MLPAPKKSNPFEAILPGRGKMLPGDSCGASVGVLGIVNECRWPGPRVLATWEGDGGTSCHSSLAWVTFKYTNIMNFLIESTILAHMQAALLDVL